MDKKALWIAGGCEGREPEPGGGAIGLHAACADADGEHAGGEAGPLPAGAEPH